LVISQVLQNVPHFAVFKRICSKTEVFKQTNKFVTIQSPAGDSVGNFVAAIGGMKGLLAPK
jgi:hypothetical protein